MPAMKPTHGKTWMPQGEVGLDARGGSPGDIGDGPGPKEGQHVLDLSTGKNKEYHKSQWPGMYKGSEADQRDTATKEALAHQYEQQSHNKHISNHPQQTLDEPYGVGAAGNGKKSVQYKSQEKGGAGGGYIVGQNGDGSKKKTWTAAHHPGKKGADDLDIDLTGWHKPGYVDLSVQQHLRDKKHQQTVLIEEESGGFGFVLGVGITVVLANYGKRIKRCLVTKAQANVAADKRRFEH